MSRRVKKFTFDLVTKTIRNPDMASDTRAPILNNGKVREKVALKPGFHLADWKRMMDVTTRPTPQPITVEELAKHNTQFDSWTSYKGKVYNITNYFPYHPGGDAILRQIAGKDCTELFIKYHRWVNIDSILGKTYIGNLVEPVAETKISSEEGEGEEGKEKSDKEEAEKGLDSSLNDLKISADESKLER